MGSFTVAVTVSIIGDATTYPLTGTATVAAAPLSASNGTVINGVAGSPTIGPATGSLLGSFSDANLGTYRRPTSRRPRARSW